MTERLRQYLRNPNVQAFSHAVRFCEGTPDEDGYRRMFGGKLFDSFADHPRQVQTFTLRKGGKLSSTAAGAYQILSRTWDGVRKKYPFPDFSPEYQDLAFVALVEGRKALADLVKGDLPTVVKKCALEWASLPGSPYGQPVKKYEEVQRVYLEHGGKLEPVGETPAQPTHSDTPEPPMLSALVPLVKVGLLEAVPKLISIFGSGSEVSNRNLKAVEAVADIAKDAIGAKNEQELIEVLKKDPVAVSMVRKAVEDNWFQLQEIGGGVEAAAKRDMAFVNNLIDQPWWAVLRSPSFLVACMLLPLVYLFVLSLIGVLGTAEWPPEVRAALAGSITGAIVGGLVGYYYGQTTSRNRTPSTPGNPT